MRSSISDLDAENMPPGQCPGTPLLESPECSTLTPPSTPTAIMPHVVGPGGDSIVAVDGTTNTTTTNKDDDEIIKPFKKKTRGTRGGKKNREKKLRAQ